MKITIFLTCLVAASAFGQWNPEKSITGNPEVIGSSVGLITTNAHLVSA